MLAINVKAPRFAHRNARNVVARDSTRVFTDAEWDQAVSRAASQYRDAEASTASADAGSGVAVEDGRVFSDPVWEEAMKKAPLLLQELDRVEQIARAPEDATDGSDAANTEGPTFTPEQWDAAIKIAIATEKAVQEKAEIDAEVEHLKMQAAELVPVTASDGPTITDVMAFSGPAPEIVNGRLAMLAIVAAAASEVSSGKSVAEQFSEAPAAVVMTVVVIIAASLIPLLNGKEQGKAVGPFNPKAELTNARAAMIGFASLVLLEAIQGGAPLF